MFFLRTSDEIFANCTQHLLDKTAITQQSPGSKARSLIEIFSEELGDAYETFSLNNGKSLLSRADGRFLDYLGDIYGASRNQAKASWTEDVDAIIRFYVEGGGTFGTINGGGDIAIPQGTLIYAGIDLGAANILERNLTEGNRLQDAIGYRTLNAYVLPSGSTEVFVSTEAVNPGNTSNVAKGALRFHDFTSYSRSADKLLRVENVAAILNGKNRESDINFKYRLQQQIKVKSGSNETALRLTALVVPGVADVKIIPYEKGSGSASVYIKGQSREVSDQLIYSVQVKLNGIASTGVRAVARKPKLLGLEAHIKVIYGEELQPEEKSAIEGAMIDVGEDYIGSLDLGESFIRSDFVSRLKAVSPSIKRLGTVAGVPIDYLYLWEYNRALDRRRPSLVAPENITAYDEERLVLEPSIEAPITML